MTIKLAGRVLTLLLHMLHKSLLKDINQGILHVQNNFLRKPDKSSPLRYKNTKEIIVNHKGTTMVKDEDN